MNCEKIMHDRGITQKFWDGLPREQQLSWKLFVFTFVLLMSFSAYRTGNRIIDGVTGGFSSLVALMVIETQRSLGRYKVKFRRNIIRTCVRLVTGAIGVFAIAYLFIGVFKLFFTIPDLFDAPMETKVTTITTSLLGVCCLFVLFRSLKIEEFIRIKLPLFLMNSFVGRSHKSINYVQFFNFEYGVVAGTTLYSMVINSLVGQLIVDILRLYR